MVATAKADSRAASASGDSVLRRLTRVVRQLVVAAASAGAYYAVTRWLLDRFGASGFFYALLVLAAVTAMVREFGPDLRELPGRARAWGSRRRTAPSDHRTAEDAADQGAPPVRPAPTTRLEAEAVFREQQEALDPAAFEAFARGFQFIDEHGKFWTIRTETGKWAFFRGGEWNEGMPLGTLTARSTG